MTDLVERVARAIGDVPKKAVDDHIEGVATYEEAMAYLKSMHRTQAKAAISIILEEAAKVAEAEVEPDMDDIPEGFENHRPSEVALATTKATKRNIVAAIRGLGGDDG